MKRTLALLAVWIVFAVTAVGVGFAASGFIDQPFAAAAGVAVPEEASPTGGAATNPTTARTGPSTPPTPTATPPSSGGRPTPTAPTPVRPTGSTPPAPGSSTTTRSVNTEAGYVGARCTRGLVTVSASPAPGWQLNGISAPGQDEGEVEFEQSGDGEASIEVTALCGVSGPTLTVQRFAGDGDAGTGPDRDADSDAGS